MSARSNLVLLLFLLMSAVLWPGCRTRSDAFVIALSDNLATLDPIGGSSVDAASERVRVLIFNSLVRKNEKFEYVPELASDIKPSEDGLTYTFTLRDGVTFHDGKALTSADAKYTLDTLLVSEAGKAASFFEGSGKDKQSFITSVETPDARTLVIRHHSAGQRRHPKGSPDGLRPFQVRPLRFGPAGTRPRSSRGILGGRAADQAVARACDCRR
jgi:ABC-type transport system substrate-binding protein